MGTLSERTAVRLHDDRREGYYVDFCVGLPAPMRVAELRADGNLIWSATGEPVDVSPAEVVFRRIGYLSVTVLGLPMLYTRVPVGTATPSPRGR